jgi:hypothetical protein
VYTRVEDESFSGALSVTAIQCLRPLDSTDTMLVTPDFSRGASPTARGDYYNFNAAKPNLSSPKGAAALPSAKPFISSNGDAALSQDVQDSPSKSAKIRALAESKALLADLKKAAAATDAAAFLAETAQAEAAKCAELDAEQAVVQSEIAALLRAESASPPAFDAGGAPSATSSGSSDDSGSSSDGGSEPAAAADVVLVSDDEEAPLNITRGSRFSALSSSDSSDSSDAEPLLVAEPQPSPKRTRSRSGRGASTRKRGGRRR